MKPTRKPPSKHDWLQKTHTSEISTWDLNQCIAFLSLSECTQIKKLPGGGTATESKELVHKQLMSLIRSENDKPTPNAVAKVNDEKEEIDFTAIVYALSLQQCFIDRAFPSVKLPQVMISSAYGSKEKVLHDIANLHQNGLLLIQMVDQYNSGRNNSVPKSNNHDDNDDIASIVSQRQ
jgi:hypothetical protein